MFPFQKYTNLQKAFHACRKCSTSQITIVRPNSLKLFSKTKNY